MCTLLSTPAIISESARGGISEVAMVVGAGYAVVRPVVAHALVKLRRFGQTMQPDLVHVDEAIEPTRNLLEAAGIAYKVIGGLAVIHHGYERFTVDVDVLVERGAMTKVAPLLDAHGFVRKRDNQLVHRATGVRVDVLEAGVKMPRPGAPDFPDPTTLAASPTAPSIVDLGPLIELKLHARRAQDIADVVELLKLVDEERYTRIEAGLPKALRADVWRLYQDALEEMAMERERP